MKFLIAYCLISFCIYFDDINSAVQNEINLPPQDWENEVEQMDPPRIKGQNLATKIKATTLFSEQDSSKNVSIRDLQLSGINGNENIKKKVISEMKDLPQPFKKYKNAIRLTTNGYVFPNKLMKYEEYEGYIIYHNVRTSEKYYVNETCEGSSANIVTIGCESASRAKIHVVLPTIIKITANFSIIHPPYETTKKGVINISLRNGTILKQITYTNQTGIYFEDAVSQVSFIKSNIDVDFEGPHSLIYNKLESFCNEIESSLEEFFVQQLNRLMNEHQLNLRSDCSLSRFAKSTDRKFDMPYFHNLNNLYVIPETKTETWKRIVFSVGPILIDGFDFNSIEFFYSEEFKDTYYYRERLIIRIKTENLRGNFQCSYNLNNGSGENSTSVFHFSIDNIVFESDQEVFFGDLWGSKYEGKGDLKVITGQTKLTPFSSNFDQNELEFAEFVLSEYLKPTIAESLNKTLFFEAKWHDNIFYNFFYNIPIPEEDEKEKKV